MILAVDVCYHNDGTATAAGVSFGGWQDVVPSAEYTSKVPSVSVGTYVPGQFYLREMPCILQLVHDHNLFHQIDTLVVDAFVYVDGKEGLGAKMHEWFRANGREIDVVGVAKTSFKSTGAPNTVVQVHRGGSKNPVHVSCAGRIILQDAGDAVRNMHGLYRIPTLLKHVDALSRGFPGGR